MKKYIFLLDSGSSYFENNNQEQTTVLPMCINIATNDADHTYVCQKEITRDQLAQFFYQNARISTSQPILGETITLLEKLFQEYEKVIILPISKELSGHYRSLLTLKQNFGDNLIVLDSLSVGLEGNWAIEELKQKIDANEIELNQEALNDYLYNHQRSVCGAVIVGDPQQLINGGRLKGIKGLIAKTLKLKLIIKFNGKLEYVNKDMKLEGAALKALDIIDKEIKFSKYGIKKITLMNDLVDKNQGERIAELIKQRLPKDVIIEPSLLPDCVIAHVGLDTFSILIESNFE